MKGGRTPIHIQRWAPADYQDDEHVRLLYSRRDWRTLTFYRTFIDRSFMAGGDLPADPESLAAMLHMPTKDVERSLSFCIGRLLVQEGDRLYQGRVRRDIAEELEFRENQAAIGRQGGLKRSVRLAQATASTSVKGSPSPPAPAPAPAPAPVACAVSGDSIPTPQGPAAPLKLKSVTPAKPAHETWLTEYGVLWCGRWGQESEPPWGEMGSEFSRPKARELRQRDPADFRERWRRFLDKSPTSQMARPARFVQGLGEWAGPRRAAKTAEQTERDLAQFKARAALVKANPRGEDETVEEHVARMEALWRQQEAGA